MLGGFWQQPMMSVFASQLALQLLHALQALQALQPLCYS